MADHSTDKHDKDALGQALRQHLAAVRDLRLARAADPHPDDPLNLKKWQSQRLASTYPDLLENPRYRPAAEFFLHELYGTKDFTARDSEVERIVPTLITMLPTRALATLVDAIRMDALSESLDADMVAQLRRAGRIASIDAHAYAAAYRACGRRDDRATQIALVAEIGAALDRLTHMPLLGTSLKMMKKPAELAGLGNLHSFLHQGFDAFRHMRGANEFLASIQTRETDVMVELLGEGSRPGNSVMICV